MFKAAKLAMVLALVSLVVGIISRILVIPIPPGIYGLEANAFLSFSQTCLLASIAFLLMDKQTKK
ncbi:MAG: hypothetical protein KKH34_11270 [Candidatus Omnitrophica bacterium]|nr:hypothetical protein [Candidatus Omnitrophota bacterium]